MIIQQGDTFQVTLTSDDNFIDFIQVEQQGRALNLDLKPGYAYDLKGITMRLEVALPELAELRLNGSPQARLDGAVFANFAAELTGSSFLHGELASTETSLTVNGSSYVKLNGSADMVYVDVCGNSVADLEVFQARDASVQASCAGQAVVNVNDSLVADASQNARIYYVGRPSTPEVRIHEHAAVGPKS